MNIKNISFLSVKQNLGKSEKFSSAFVSSPSLFKLNKPLMADVVSFSGKRYEEETIVNPTNHCAYCGCKVYNQQQIDSLAKEIMNSRSNRLEGKIKSIREKLTEAKNSIELSSAKKESNKKEIEFFDKLLELSSTRAYMSGEDILKSVYNIEKDEALKLINKNLLPLQKTIDHVSPQNLEQKNNNSDINLVEACTCCNGRLKEGMSFPEFYLMFPSIKNNMPSNKFDFAVNNVLDNSQDNILKRLSATNLLKHLSLLFIQRKETSNYLDSIDYRIEGCKSSINGAVESCKSEIADKERQISDLQAKLDTLNKDDEYTAIVNRQKLSNDIEVNDNLISSLKGKRERISNKINEIRNNNSSNKSRKKNKNNVKPMTKEEAEAEIKSLKQELTSLKEQITSREETKSSLLAQVSELNSKFPTIEMYQNIKREAERVYNAYLSLEEVKKSLVQNTNEYKNIEEKMQYIKSFMDVIPNSNFNADDYAKDDVVKFQRYNELNEALNYILTHPNGGSVRNCIHSAAQKTIESEISDLKKEDIIIDFNMALKKKELQKYYDSLSKKFENVKQKITYDNKDIIQYERIIKQMSKDEAYSRMLESQDAIRRLSEKETYIKIPQTISKLRTEILLLNNTIDDLLKKQNEIIQSTTNSQI